MAGGQNRAQTSLGRMFLENTAPFAQSIPTAKICPQLEASSCVLSASFFQGLQRLELDGLPCVRYSWSSGGLCCSVENSTAVIFSSVALSCG